VGIQTEMYCQQIRENWFRKIGASTKWPEEEEHISIVPNKPILSAISSSAQITANQGSISP
jgi:hypothetical protein